MDPQSTGVDFNNELTITDSLNIMNYIYLYNGAGDICRAPATL